MIRDETILQGLNQLTSWGILSTDTSLVVTGWNQWLESHSGYSAEKIVGRHLLEVFPDLVSRRIAQFYRQALEGRVVVLSQRLHKYLLAMPPSVEDSRLSHMQQSTRLAPLVQDGAIVGTLTLIEDVTERVVYDAELSAQTRQQAAVAALGQQALAGDDLTTLLSQTATVVIETLDLEFSAIWEIVSDNQTLLMRAGAGWKENYVGRLTLEARPDSPTGYTLESREPVIIKDLSQDTRFATPAYLQQHGAVSGMSVAIIGGGSLLGVLGVYTTQHRAFTAENIHFLQAAAHVLGLAIERKRLEQELQVRVGQLADRDKRKDEFLAMLAHELRNPLAPIQNALRYLQLQSLPDSQLRHAQDVIERQVRQMTRLVDDLLDVSRITGGKVILRKEPLDLSSVIMRAVEISRPLIDSRNHNLRITLPPDPVFLEADPTRLAQVVANLLNNAAKFTPMGGQIDLTVEHTQDAALVRVRDTGVGLAPDMLSSIFDLFTQVQGSLSRSEGGLGIGLSLVRGLVEMHGGSVSAQSNGLGRGSEFVIRLPILKEATAWVSPAEEKTKAQKLRPRRLLVVDDNVDAAESLALLLRLNGHEVWTAHDGVEAMETMRTRSPDVVLLDIGLPRMDGLEVARRIRQELCMKNAVLIALTGYSQEEDRRRSLDAGFNAHLIKPVDLDALDAVLSHTEAIASAI
jgi:PAS domain S-box-containing protein